MSCMPGEPAEPLRPSQDPDQMVGLLQQQMARLKRVFAWERWLLEPRSFDPPEDATDDPAEDDPAGDEPSS